MEKKYKFSWDLLGNIDIGRPNLGREVKLEVFRLMQFTLRDVIEEAFGTEESDRIFYAAGRKAGKAFYDHVLQGCTELKDFVKRLQEALKEMKIGILRLESMTPDARKLVITVDEDV
ncbi:MAG: hypothetical protein FWE49_04890, partial [Synergistaceae bacterium]|nr:hypothetical protein [Synergistaceae bacterium]